MPATRLSRWVASRAAAEERVIELPEAFHAATDDLPYADDWAGTHRAVPG
jgi:hypothetical protein